MSRRFAALPAANVGLMLPASVACDTALLALHLAGKLPVVLNWTTGPANLAHAARIMGLTHVVTSRAFIDRTGIEIEGVEYLHLEQIRKEMGKFELLRTLLMVRWLPGHVRKLVPHTSPDQPAVVLFTSGSEKAPKAVPLTHRNILTNQRIGIPFLGFTHARFHPRLPAGLPQFRHDGDLPAAAPGRHARRPPPRPDGCRRPGPQDRRLSADHPRRHADVHQLHPRTRRARAADLAAADRRRRGELSAAASASAAPTWRRRRRCWRATASPNARRWSRRNTVAANRPGTLGKPMPGVEVLVVDLETDEPLPAEPDWACCWSAARPSFPATSATRARRRSRSATASAGTSPATWRRSTTTASSISAAG